MTTEYSDLICIGTGLSGIGLASQLRRKWKFDSMHLYDRNESYSGTWWSNHYPGASSDVAAPLYSFSFHPHADLSYWLPKYDDMRSYITSVVQKYRLGPYMSFRTECQSARWDEDRCIWTLHLKKLGTGRSFVHECRILISATGTLVDPKIPRIPGAETFCGEQFHSSRWKDDVSLQDKNVIVTGNGSTGTQIIPAISAKVKTLTHIIRSPHWLTPYRPPPFKHWLFKFFHSRFTGLTRLYCVVAGETMSSVLNLNARGAQLREQLENESRNYILTNAPKHYHEMLLPTYAMGCKRRVFDLNGSYIRSLHADNIKLTNDPILCITQNGIQTSGAFYPADIIVYATGFETNGGLGALRIYGTNGMWLDEHWIGMGGRSAYNCIAVHGFPNFFMLYGPNSNNGTSILMLVENSIVAILQLVRPVLKGAAKRIEVKKEPYEQYTWEVQKACKKLVMSASSCNSWYVTADDWNGTTYPWSQIHFWWRCKYLTWSDWEYKYSEQPRQLHVISLFVGRITIIGLLVVLIALISARL